ncbi:MAG: DUF2752 domain-containing protein [Pyrinomonadaceae bacterium]
MLLQTAFPLVSSVLRDRRFSTLFTGVVGVQICLSSLSLPAWQCPILHATGIPCPGCGLSRAMMLLVRGELRASIRFHAFAPFFLLLITSLVIAALLPRSMIQPVINKVEALERQTKLTVIILAGLILYWLARLLFFPAFVQLIRG